MWNLIEERFSAAALTPKGRRARQAIFQATREFVADRGLTAASLELIANGASLTQAALRHHFPTREALISAFFTAARDSFQEHVSVQHADLSLSPRERLEKCIGWHLEYMESVETAFWLEASAYWLRDEHDRRARDHWYRWLTNEYSVLIGQIQADLSRTERERRAYAILTLLLGAWITHGRGSSLGRPVDIVGERRLLIDTALDIATQ